MSPEQLLLAALSAVTTSLVYMFGLLWKRPQECERWRNEKEPLIEEMAQQLGIHSGITRMVNTCNIENCPFSGKLSAGTFSLHPIKKP